MASEEQTQTAAPTIRASLILRGFGDDPEVVTRTLQLEPTRKGRAGETLISSSGQPIPNNVKTTFWALQSRLSPQSAISEHVADVALQIGPAQEKLSRLPHGTTIAFRCTIIPEGDLPLLSVDARSAAVLAQINASLELDIMSVDGPS